MPVGLQCVKAPSAGLSRSRRADHSTCAIVCSLRYFNRLNFQRPAPVSTAGFSVRRKVGAGGSTAPPVLDKPDVSAVTDQYAKSVKYTGVHHVALLVSNLERSMEFYVGVLGLNVNPDRPHSKLPYRGAWLWIGPEMIHLMELDNPDPLTGRPEHGGRDRHFCIGVTDIKPLVTKLQAANIQYTMSMSGRPAVFFRDPDMNCLEVVEQEPWR